MTDVSQAQKMAMLADADPDQRLIARIAEGDKQAFENFFDRHAPRINGLIVTLLRGGADADDVLQDTFEQVWRQASSYTPSRGTPTVWLSMIARSRARDALRKMKRQGRWSREPMEVAEEQANSGQTPDAAVETLESRAQVIAALRCLPPEQSRPIEMAFFQGLTHEEISQCLGLPLGTTKTRIRRGLLAMQSSLQSTG
jgi:RNA polymerase sigma-70 factor (ECF subfamily)